MNRDTAHLTKRYFGELLAGRLDVAGEILAADLEFYGPNYWGEVMQGREAFTGFVRYLRSAFPDLTFSIQDELENGDRSATRFTFTATHLGEWQGIEPTGRRIDIPGVDLFRFAGGRIREIRIYYDTLGLMQQLGAAPSPTVERVSP